MSTDPFLKWAGGKRWLTARSDFRIPAFCGTYIEPFLGGGAMFFAVSPDRALLSDLNERLVETYEVIRDDWQKLVRILGRHHKQHCATYYYRQRDRVPDTALGRAAQFIYLNRACWNGLYRVNKLGRFNVPIGTKDWILSGEDDFGSISSRLKNAKLIACDFEESIDKALHGDFVFADPPYTVAHNFNGFVKYNEKIFSWSDQVRLANSLKRAVERGATVVATNANHPTICELYAEFPVVRPVARASIISGQAKGRQDTSELLIASERML